MGLLVMIFPVSLFAQDRNLTEFPIVPYKNLEVKELNESISTAEKGKEGKRPTINRYWNVLKIKTLVNKTQKML